TASTFYSERNNRVGLLSILILKVAHAVIVWRRYLNCVTTVYSFFALYAKATENCMKWLVIFFFAMGVMLAQVQTTTSITGTVTDPQGAVLAGASVRVTNQNTGAIRDSTTGADGVYSFPSLPGGTYSITVSAHGFKTAA